LITLKNISKSFHAGSELVIAADAINLTVNKSDFILVAGPNGSGKSTLLNLIAGTVKADSGKIIFEKKDITSLKDFERSKYFSHIFQDPMAGTAAELSVLENFRLAYLRTKNKNLTVGTNEVFRKFVSEKVSVLELGLEKKLDQAVGTLSGGQRQSLALLMAVADDTKLLLLDEPTAALDPRTARLIINLTAKIISSLNLTALMVTHQMKDVLEFGNRVLFMSEGRIVQDLAESEKKQLNINELFAWFG
jgi:putative tryptophan/tyrosine transport system ATP-binding protein